MWWWLLACSGTKESGLECSELPNPPVISGCMSTVAGGDLTGTVVDLGTGSFPADCLYALGDDPGDGWWVTVEDGSGNQGTIGIAIPDAQNPLAVGDPAHLLAAYAMADFGPTVAAVEVRDGLDALVAWVGIGGTVSELKAPIGMELSQGPEVCETGDDCGTWAAYDLVVAADGHRQTISYGRSGSVGDWTVYHAGDLQALNYASCPDWYKSELRMGIRR